MDTDPAWYYVTDFEVDSPLEGFVTVDLEGQDADEKELPCYRVSFSVEQARQLRDALAAYLD
jgi:hypothetical protein